MSTTIFNFFRNAQVLRADGTTSANSPIMYAPCMLINDSAGLSPPSNGVRLMPSGVTAPGFIQLVANTTLFSITIYPVSGDTVNGANSATGVVLPSQSACALSCTPSKGMWFGAYAGLAI